MKYWCADQRRLSVVAQAVNGPNALEFLEVLDRGAPPGVPRQRTLFVRLLRAPSLPLQPSNIRIGGGERIQQVAVEWCALADALPPASEPGLVDSIEPAARPRTLVVRTPASGDFSRYTFSLVKGDDGPSPPDEFDPRLASLEFSFKVECPTDFDCAEALPCPPSPPARANIDYLAKDYASFRRLMLDRMGLLVPGWTERSAADLGVALVELLAYAADNLSYRQDVIGTEAYLATARQRISVRRHARLVDYALHEGCNARAFVHVEVSQPLTLPAHTPLLTRRPGLPVVLKASGESDADAVVREAVRRGAEAFESVVPVMLEPALNALRFYTWGERECCLPRGSTRATLRDDNAAPLKEKQFLVLEELAPQAISGGTEVPGHEPRRCVVRLTRVSSSTDRHGGLFEPQPHDGPVRVLEIEWDPADALPFALPLSRAEPSLHEVAVARANVLLVEHGRRVRREALGAVPPPRGRVMARFHPVLAEWPLTHHFALAERLAAAPDSEAWCPAQALLALDPRRAKPRLELSSAEPGPTSTPGSSPDPLPSTPPPLARKWAPVPDLLSSSGLDAHFVAEVANDARAHLRFGDGKHGIRPAEGTTFEAHYRVGNGARGNVGAEAIAHVVGAFGAEILRVRNPLPAVGGIEPEDLEAARRDAPQAFRTQERAVTAADYAAAAERRPDVQRAAATFRWTGSWYTVFLTPDRVGGGAVEPAFASSVRRHLERFRMAGYDLHVDSPRHVPLDIALHVCVKPGAVRAQVLREVRRVLSSEVLPDGRLGMFHPDRFTFGEPVYASRIVAAVQAIEGVEAVRLDRFQRLVDPSPTSLEEEVIRLARLEIAQLANDPNYPERGRLRVSAGGRA